jgi:hypothetical protein
MPWPTVFMFLAAILFALGAILWRWWPVATERPYYPPFLFGGLFFMALSIVWPQLGK